MRLSDDVLSAQANAFINLLHGATIKFYDGISLSSFADDVGSKQPLAAVILPAPAAVETKNGTIRFNAPEKVTALDSGRATWFRIYSNAGKVLADGTVGTSDNCDMRMADNQLIKGASLTLQDWVHEVK